MHKLLYNTPAVTWGEALPIGNGRMGGMIYGNIQTDIIELNEDSIWYGAPRDRNNKDALSNLQLVRKHILSGEIKKAEQLLEISFSGTPQSQRPYQTLGKMLVRMNNPEGEVSNYQRSLSLDEGVCEVVYDQQGGTNKREYFISYPAQVMVVRYRAQETGKLSFRVLLERGKYYDEAGRLDNDTIFINGNLGKGGNEFIVALSGEVKGGKIYATGEHLIVEDTNEVVFYLAVGTTFYQKNPTEYVKTCLEKARRKGFEKLLEEHKKDVGSLMNRVDFSLGEVEDIEKLPINERLKRLKEGKEDLNLIKLYFDYGRYLLMSSSRPGTLPANLQGIWNDQMTPCWDSKYTININTEMNYWPAEVCNLSECHLPLFELLKRMVINGKETAKKMYGCRGFVAHHNTDIWADTAPQDIYIPATYWPMGGAWLTTHLWTHYSYNQDEEWLRETAYPIMKEAVVFFVDYLIEDGGNYVTCPSVSPENTYILPSGEQGRVCAGPAMDNQILRDLFCQFNQTCNILGETGELNEIICDILEKLPETKIGKHGQIVEWKEDYDEMEPGHRHISQLYALYPSNQITREKTPALAEAAKKTLERRLTFGGGHTGWSQAWLINLYARLWQGNDAYDCILRLLGNSTFSNLMDNHPLGNGFVFQIDGNFGACAAVAEMLMQSDHQGVFILPALPAQWKKGYIKGLCIHGAAMIDINWDLEEKHIVEVKLYGAKQTLKRTLKFCKEVQNVEVTCNQVKTIVFSA